VQVKKLCVYFRLDTLRTVQLIGTDYDLKEAKLTKATSARKLDAEATYEVKIISTGEKLKMKGQNLSKYIGVVDTV
jgi:hypothetical protein